MESYLQIENLNKSFGETVLFEHLDLNIAEGERVGLIARNGAGKSTLLNILAGTEDYQKGQITFRRDIRKAYLMQNPSYPAGTTVMEACFTGEAPIMKVIKEYEAAVCSGDETLMHEAIACMDACRGWDYESNAKRILTQLGIADFNQPLEELSGGQVKRVALAHALMGDPDLLILDEPTNHLDIDATLWLEEFLASSRLTLLMVTHDRYLLDRVCNRIIELDDHMAYSYSGNYSYYLEKRRERLDAAEAQNESDRNLYRRELDWMRRQPQARATKARSRKDAFHELEERIRTRRQETEMQLDMKASYIGKKIFEIKHLDKFYGDYTILHDFSYTFNRHEKLGISGENGAGKSTFLRMLIGEEPVDGGTIDIGSTVRFGYYSQQGMEFDGNTKVIDVVSSIAEHITLSDGRTKSASQFLQYFLFPPSTQQKFVCKLSGGEKRRLYLCTILMRNPNFLILDEPTNDLDIMTLQVLEEYLSGYSGCLIVVSHDRFFMDKVADHMLIFEGNGKIKDFPGTYSQYIEWSRLKKEIATEESSAPSQSSEDKSKTSRRAQKRPQKLSFKEKRELEELEARMEEMNAEKKHLEELLNSGSLNSKALTDNSIRISELIGQIDEAEMRWLELSEKEN